jgi:branched-chain amino acid transport system ATP-binding protein
MALLQAEGLTRSFGSLIAVDDLDLTVTEGEIRAIIGPNGAGKTTLFHLLSGVLFPTAGRVRFRDQDVTGLPVSARVHLGLTRSFQVTSLFPNLTVGENVQLAVQTRRSLAPLWFPRAQRRQISDHVHHVLRLVALEGAADLFPTQLAHGDQRRLEIALVLAPAPRLLLLDEPTAGMSLGETTSIAALIKRINRGEGVTVCIVEHDMQVVMNLADQITVLNQGRLLAEGPPDLIAADPHVQEAYLGRRRAAS